MISKLADQNVVLAQKLALLERRVAEGGRSSSCPSAAVAEEPRCCVVVLRRLVLLCRWLLDTGWRRRSLWRLAVGSPIALWLVVVSDRRRRRGQYSERNRFEPEEE